MQADKNIYITLHLIPLSKEMNCLSIYISKTSNILPTIKELPGSHCVNNYGDKFKVIHEVKTQIKPSGVILLHVVSKFPYAQFLFILLQLTYSSELNSSYSKTIPLYIVLCHFWLVLEDNIKWILLLVLDFACSSSAVYLWGVFCR